MRALILVYHAIERGPAPLCTPPDLFREHLEVIASSGARVVTLDRVAGDQRGGPGEPAVAITFDDGFASVVDEAAPLLHERAMPATLFQVAGFLGATNEWPTQPPRAPRRTLAGAAALAELARAGFEIGSHGTDHTPLGGAGAAVVRREVVESRRRLEDAVGVAVRWYAYPYGSFPGAAGRDTVARTYAGACGNLLRRADGHAERYALPRVDAHYLRRPRLLRRALEGDDAYLLVRRLAARGRRLVQRDYAG